MSIFFTDIKMALEGKSGGPSEPSSRGRGAYRGSRGSSFNGGRGGRGDFSDRGGRGGSRGGSRGGGAFFASGDRKRDHFESNMFVFNIYHFLFYLTSPI